MPSTPGTSLFPASLDDADSLFRSANNASSTLNGGITDSAVTLTLASGSLFPNSGAVSIDNEIIYYTSKSSNTLSGLVRGQDGTTAASHSNGATVSARIISRHLAVLIDAILAIQAKVGASSSTPTTGKVLTATGTGTSAWADPTATNVAAGYNEVALSSYASLSAALAAIGSTYTSLIITTATTVSSSISIPANVNLRLTGQGSFSISSGQTLTISGMIEAPYRQIFSGSGTVALGSTFNQPVVPQWWGAKGDGSTDDTLAIQAALNCFGVDPAHSGTILFPRSNYKITNTLVFRGSSTYGVALVGEMSTRGLAGSTLSWYGATGGTMLYCLGLNSSVIENLELYGRSIAATGIWLDSTNVYTPASAVSISSISRSSNVVTVTTSSAHGLTANKNVAQIAGVTDSTFNGYFKVLTVADSTHFTYSQSGSNTTSGSGTSQTYISGGSAENFIRHVTVGNVTGTDSAAIAFGHSHTTTMQVSEVHMEGLHLTGNADSTSYYGVKTFNNGNTKNFSLSDSVIYGFNFAVDWSNASGTFSISRLITLSIKDTILKSGAQGVMVVNGLEDESTSVRLLTGTTSSNPGAVTLQAVSFESSAPSDDYIINYSGALTLIGNKFLNGRTGSSIAKVVIDSPPFNSSSPSTLFSFGNLYQNAVAGYAPIYDGSGNVVLPSYYANQPVAVVSLGDYGGSFGTLVKLNNFIPLQTLVSQANTRASSSGFIRMGGTDKIAFRNQADSGDVTAITKDSSDVIQVGDTAGVKTVGSLTVNGGTAISKILKGTVTIDPASINANTVSEQSFTLTGAATGDSLRLNPPTAGLTAGLTVMQCYVSAADTVKITFWNSTGSPIDAASASWTYSIIR